MWIPFCPTDPVTPKGSLTPRAVVLHRTYGQWAGDYAVIKNQGLCQLLVGKDQGQWVQFMDTTSVAYHCNGANFQAFGIEFTGVNEDPLTPWQLTCLGAILKTVNQYQNIPLTYTAPGTVPDASVWVNGGGFQGVISHVSVKTDDGTAQHTDMVTLSDYNTALGAPPVEDDDMTPDQAAQLNAVTNTVGAINTAIFDPNLGLQHQLVNVLPAQIAALKAEIEALKGVGGTAVTPVKFAGTFTAAAT